MGKPILLALDHNAATLQVTETLLRNRYAVNYEVVCERSPTRALELLHGWQVACEQVAVVLVSQRLPETTGTDFLGRIHALCPYAKRVLLFDRGDSAAMTQIRRAVALGQTDYFIVKPSGEPDEAFHQLITDLLVEWTGANQETFVAVEIVGEQWDTRSHEFRDLLERNGVPYRFYDDDSEQGRALLEQVQRPAGPFPVTVLYNGAVLTNPSPAQMADALGAPVQPPHGLYDLTIVGGGPAGLSAAVYGASEGVRTLVVEREALGGQAGTSSRIRNYLGFPRGIGGGELAQRAASQAALFGAEFYLLRAGVALRSEGGRYTLTLSDGVEVASRTVLLSMGVSYRRLEIPSLERLMGAGVFYGAALTEAEALAGQPVYVVGGGNSAGQAALHLAQYASQVTLLVRGPSLAESMSSYLIDEMGSRTNIAVRLNTQVVEGRGAEQLESVLLQESGGATEEVAAAGLFILIGAEPHTAWLPPEIARDAQGYLLTGRDVLHDGALPPGWPLARLPYPMETSAPGVFAAGDVRHRALKRVASAVGEGPLVVSQVHQVLGGG